MGALGGHMAHLHESLELTFEELAAILDSVANADVEATEKVEEVKASVGTEEGLVVETAVDEADKEDAEVPNSIQAEEETLTEKYKKAFSLDQFEIN